MHASSPVPPEENRAMDLPVRVEQTHRLRFTADVWDTADATLANVLAADAGSAGRLLVFIDAGLADAWPDTERKLAGYLQHHRCPVTLIRPVHRVLAGEAIKREPGHILPILQQIAEARIDRQSYVLVIGGGAVLDAVGFAAAVVHRGVRLIRMPTTTLAQADSGVGVKNGINAFGQKNFIGTFAVPWAVISSLHWLTTLPDREWCSGFSEAVKVSLLKDPSLFDLIARNATRLRTSGGCVQPLSAEIIRRSAILHAQHIASGGDPFEQGSARPLDFGHWAAHRLELMTSHHLSHGEAVSIGLALDCTYAARVGLLPPTVCATILDVLHQLGLPLRHDALSHRDDLFRGLDDFREHLGGELTITLLRDIGRSVEVHSIDRDAMAAAVTDLLDHCRAEVVK